MDRAKQVELFHKTFGHPVGDKPQLIPQERAQLRKNLIQEELDEYFEAAQNGDLVEVADAITDMLYVVYGTAVEHGLQDVINPMFNEVQESNMSKLGEDGKPIYREEDNKILKGPNYFKPNLKKFLPEEFQ